MSDSASGAAVADQLSPAKQALADLAHRIRGERLEESGPDAGLVSLIDVVGDLGRALAGPDPGTVRSVLPSIAAVRESLEDPNDRQFGAVARTPRKALQHPKLAAAYAAGALWACSSMLNGFLDSAAAFQRRRAGKASRAEVREAALDLVRKVGPIRPVDVRSRLEGQGAVADPATVSRALSDLLDQRAIEPISPPEGADRRARYYRATDADPDVADAVRLELRSHLDDLGKRLPEDRLQGLVEEELSLVLAHPER